MKNLLLILCILIQSILLMAQAQQSPNPIPPTPAKERIESFQQRQALEKNSIVNEIEFQSVGPTVISGRVTDIAVKESDPSHFYVAYASGGLWKTENNGTSFEPLFDKEAVMTIGDIAVNWKDNIIWIGTGEVNSSRSSYSGIGMYKSTDGGETWQHKGLDESHHIGRIILHPENPNIAWVAVLGHLYSPNKERGIYKTINGGDTWEQVLFVNENSGAIDLIIDPSDPNTLYAATWHRERRAWNFVESGEGSGIHKSTDGGDTWTLMTTKKSGYPTGEGVGRIGISMHQENGKTVLYSILDNYYRRDKKLLADKFGLSKDKLREMSKEAFLKLDKKKIASYLGDEGFPEKYSTDKVIQMVKSDQIKPAALVEYTEDANALLFDTPVIGAEIYRSDDEGKTWKKTHDDYINSVYNSYGYYFGTIRVSPHDSEKIYFAGVPVVRSDDGGKTFENINGRNVHVDHHALWCNPNRDKHLILGNDGGINISYDDGESWTKCNTPAVGQFYAIAVDMDRPYNIYGGLQDNGVWTGPSNYKASSRWHNSGHYPYKELLGGDGMQVAVDTRDNNTVYTGFQFGWYYRIDKQSGDQELIKPQHELGESPLRFNWQTPIHLSEHNQDILYLGANKLYRSFNQGDDWAAISDDLTNGGIKGDVAYGTITTMDESPFRFGEIYIGTDDGNVYRTDDGGGNWMDISKGLPEHLWVTGIYASRHNKGTVYVSLNGYRWDDFKAYIYKSEDYGKTWTALGKDLPLEPVNIIKEDLINPNLIYVGTDHGLYISMDGGNAFQLMNNGLPAVSVHDVVVHPRDDELVVGTHGRSIYKADIAPLQSLQGDLMNSAILAYDIPSRKYSSRWGNKPTIWTKSFDPEIKITYFTNSEGTVNIKVKMSDGTVLKSWNATAKKGINFEKYNLSIESRAASALESLLRKNAKEGNVKVKAGENGIYYLRAGEYTVEFEKNGEKDSKVLVIK